MCPYFLPRRRTAPSLQRDKPRDCDNPIFGNSAAVHQWLAVILRRPVRCLDCRIDVVVTVTVGLQPDSNLKLSPSPVGSQIADRIYAKSLLVQALPWCRRSAGSPSLSAARVDPQLDVLRRHQLPVTVGRECHASTVRSESSSIMVTDTRKGEGPREQRLKLVRPARPFRGSGCRTHQARYRPHLGGRHRVGRRVLLDELLEEVTVLPGCIDVTNSPSAPGAGPLKRLDSKESEFGSLIVSEGLKTQNPTGGYNPGARENEGRPHPEDAIPVTQHPQTVVTCCSSAHCGQCQSSDLRGGVPQLRDPALGVTF
jgi:hypothetical protein